MSATYVAVKPGLPMLNETNAPQANIEPLKVPKFEDLCRELEQASPLDVVQFGNTVLHQAAIHLDDSLILIRNPSIAYLTGVLEDLVPSQFNRAPRPATRKNILDFAQFRKTPDANSDTNTVHQVLNQLSHINKTLVPEANAIAARIQHYEENCRFFKLSCAALEVYVKALEFHKRQVANPPASPETDHETDLASIARRSAIAANAQALTGRSQLLQNWIKHLQEVQETLKDLRILDGLFYERIAALIRLELKPVLAYARDPQTGSGPNTVTTLESSLAQCRQTLQLIIAQLTDRKTHINNIHAVLAIHHEKLNICLADDWRGTLSACMHENPR